MDIKIEKIAFKKKKIEITVRWTGYFHNPPDAQEQDYADSSTEEVTLILRE